MALSLSNLGVWGGDSGNFASWSSTSLATDPRTRTSGSVTPTNGNTLVAVVHWAIPSGAGTNLTGFTITDSLGLTWTEQLANKVLDSSNGFGSTFKVFTATATGSSMTVTVRDTTAMGADTAAANVALHLFQIAGGVGSVTNATKVPSAVLGTGITDANAYTLTLGSAPASSSIVLAGRHGVVNGSSALLATPGSGWTEIYDTSAAGAFGFETQYRTGTTSTSVPWVDISTGDTIYDTTGAVWAMEFTDGGGGAAKSLAIPRRALRTFTRRF